MFKKCISISFLTLFVATFAFAQNTNSSGTTTARPRTTSTKQAAKSNEPAADTPRTQGTAPATGATQDKPAAPAQAPGSGAVLAAFESLLDGIRKSNVDAVTKVYWNSPRLQLFNNNGTVTKGWDQMRKNRESSYPDIKDVKLDVRDLSITMMGRDAALVTCLWTQSQTYKGTPETATGRMTLVFRRFGNNWRAVHLHTSPDRPDPSRVLPSEQSTPAPTPSPLNR